MKCLQLIIQFYSHTRSFTFRNLSTKISKEVFNSRPSNIYTSWSFKNRIQRSTLSATKLHTMMHYQIQVRRLIQHHYKTISYQNRDLQIRFGSVYILIRME